jgi:hypothetical protein
VLAVAGFMAFPFLAILWMLLRDAIMLRRRRRRAQIVGVCFACGYNLTGNVSGTCPECGGTVG